VKRLASSFAVIWRLSVPYFRSEDRWPGRILRRETTGADAYLDVVTERGNLVVRVPATNGARPGDLVALEFAQQFVRRFDLVSGIAIA